jgi:allantoinase
VGLYGRKGALAPGFDADMIAFDPDALFTVDPAALQHKNPLTPYARRALFGRVRTTWLRGARVHHEGAFTPPRGRWISREQ